MRNTIQTGVPYQSKCTQSVSELSKRGKTNKTKTGVDLEMVRSNTALNWCRLIIYDSVKTSELLLNSRLPPPGVAHTRLGGGRLSFDNLLPFGGRRPARMCGGWAGPGGFFRAQSQTQDSPQTNGVSSPVIITLPPAFFLFLFFLYARETKKKRKGGIGASGSPVWSEAVLPL